MIFPRAHGAAQDYEAVGRRLRAAVAAGELSGEQARAMLVALWKVGGDKSDKRKSRRARAMPN